MSLKIQENVPLAPLTTFGIGGPARYFADVRTEDDIQEGFNKAQEHGIPFIVISGGSNLLVPDEGLDAFVVRVRGDLYSAKEGTVDTWAGTNLLGLIKAMATQGYGGWESLAGIPGSIGGAVRGNAGAFGTEIKDVLVSARALNIKTGEMKTFSNAECEFSYRMSFFKKNLDWLVTRAIIELEKTEPEESSKRIVETIAEREKRHIQDVRAAGSFFVNPVAPREIQELFEKEKGVKSREGRVPAGWLIEKAGMKGEKVGGAQSSPQHPNYIVNTGNATAKDVRELAEKIKKAVEEKFGVRLEEEAVILRQL